jgi:hypothetical protein
MQFCDTEVMRAHLAEISKMAAPDALVSWRPRVLVLDHVGWHLAIALVVQGNILPLPARSPELNGPERLAVLRNSRLSNCVFRCYLGAPGPSDDALGGRVPINPVRPSPRGGGIGHPD